MTTADTASHLRLALATLERSRARIEALERDQDEPIAIVGMGCRLPGGVTDIRSFWSLVEQGVDAVTELPEARWKGRGAVDADRTAPGKVYSPAMAVIDEADAFDAAFFGISPREAERMDPQQRVLLEVTLEALESAGHGLDSLRGSPTGVFVGICANDFGNRFPLDSLDTYSATGRSLATASGRLSYVFGLQGPSMSVDTACSSSLVAVHLASQSLRRRESKLALVGGVHVVAGPETSVSMAKLNALSPTGRCRAFSADADGYVRGEGCVVLVLKRLDEAVKDGDPVLAVIKASAVNQDGRSNGLTAPSGAAQAALLRACLRNSGLQPADVAYVEAHGTGTELGDPIELNAIAAVYGVERAADEPLWVGSGKTNLGHLEAAAGIAGLLRAALALRHGTIPPNLHLASPNPHFDWAAHPVRVPTAATPFPTGRQGSRVAAVSSFGFSGTNAHVILEEAPVRPQPAVQRPELDWLVLAAASEASLRRGATQMAARLGEPGMDFHALCQASRERRNAYPWRLAVSGAQAGDLAERLRAWAGGTPHDDLVHARADRAARGVVAVFPGQGAQWAGMGRELYADAAGAFRLAFNACEQAVQRHAGHSMRAALLASPDTFTQLEVSVIQPLLFTMSVSLAEHVRSLGVPIAAVIGQSMGEIAAAVVAGALSLDDGARIVCVRSRMALQARGGSMGLVELGRDAVEAAICEQAADVSVAACNGPGSTLVAGDAAPVASFLAALEARNVFCRRVRVDYASHSAFMDPLLAPLQAALEGIAPRDGAVPIYSTVRAGPVLGSQLTPAYWADNLRQPVLFHSAIERLIADGHRLFLELAPKPLLASAIEDTLAEARAVGCVVTAMRDDEPAHRTAARAVALLYTHGADLTAPEPAHRLPLTELPPYPWSRTRHPLPAFEGRQRRGSENQAILDTFRPVAGGGLTWLHEGELSREQPLVDQHRVHSGAMLPGAGYLCAALEAARRVWPATCVALTDVRFDQALVFREDKHSTLSLQLLLMEESAGEASWRLASRDSEDAGKAGWTFHAQGRLERRDRLQAAGEWPPELQQRLPRRLSGGELYEALSEAGLDYGPRFRQVEQLWYDDGEFLARLKPASPAEGLDVFSLDASLHGLAWLAWQGDGDTPLPVGASEIQFAVGGGVPAWVHGVRRAPASAGENTEADLVIWDEAGELLARIGSLKARSPEGRATRLPGAARWLHRQGWLQQPLAGAQSAGEWGADWLVVSAGAWPAAALDRLCTRLGTAGFFAWSPGDGPAPLRERLRAWAAQLVTAPRRLAYLSQGVGVSDAAVPPDFDAAVAALHLVHAVDQAFASTASPWLHWVTQGTQAVEAGEELALAVAVGDAAVWAFARTLSAERPELRNRCIDLARGEASSQLAALADELGADSPETEVALRQARWVGRLRAVPLPAEAPPAVSLAGEPFRVEIDTPGVLGSLALRALSRTKPAPGHVEVEVEAAGLNFADTMRAMGFFLDPDEKTVALGTECVGTVSQLGEGVSGLRLGQRVIALGEHCLASHVAVDARFVAALPDNIPASEAAGLPIAFMTAWHALRDVVSLKAGQRVLIHSATGGTGLAAVQLAQRTGAEIFATAGSEAKRQLLKDMGIRHVFDSRSESFHREIFAATHGLGIDVVLNSLSGQAIERNMRVLAPDGWFLELGKRDIHEQGQLPLGHFKKRIRYVAVDLAGLQKQRPGEFADLFQRVVGALRDKAIAPLLTQAFPVGQVADVFKRMASAQHAGKQVLLMRAPAGALAHPGGPAPLLRGTQLVTGGLGGLGLALAHWLVEHGARHLVLAGRSEPDASALARINALRALGAQVRAVRVDVSEPSDLARHWPAIADGDVPLRGVFHLAGLLRDGLVDTQTADDVRTVLSPKARGAWNLHAACEGLALDHFVLYSSASVLLPSSSQAGYAAANAFVDALASHRRSRALPALSVQWGPFAEVGLAAADSSRGERLAEKGSRSLTPGQGHAYLGALMKRDGGVIGTFPFDARKWLLSNPQIASLPRYAELRGHAAPGLRAGAALQGLAELPAQARQTHLAGLLRKRTAELLRLDERDMPEGASFQEMGMNSLTGLELRNRIEADLGLRLSSAMLWQHPTVDALAAFLDGRIAGASAATVAAPGEVAVPDGQSVAATEVIDKWFLVPRRSVQPRLRVFCIPFLGGMSSVFSGWPKHLADEVEVQALQLPGRPPRHLEVAYDSLRTLVPALAQAVSARIDDLPYMIYGHSLGALTAFHLVRELRTRGQRLPAHMFLGAYPAPHLHNPLKDIADLSDGGLIETLRHLRGMPEQVLCDRELLAVFLPSLRADLQMLKSDRFVEAPALDVPATLLAGRHDHLVTPPEIEAWRQHFGGPVDVRLFEGGHFFLREVEHELVGLVRERCSSLLADE